MSDMIKLYVVEWSPSAKQIHIQHIDQTIQNNLYAISRYEETKFVPDFVVVGVAETREEADAMADRIEKEFK